MDLSGYSRYWGEFKHSYALIRSRAAAASDLTRCLIFDLYSSAYVIIEDDDLADALVEKMLQEGVRVVDEIPAVISPFAEVHRAVGEGRITMDEANRRLRELRVQKDGRREWLRKNNLLDEKPPRQP